MLNHLNFYKYFTQFDAEGSSNFALPLVLQAAQKDKLISEDDKFRGKDELQKVVDSFQEKIKQLVEKKSQEVA